MNNLVKVGIFMTVAVVGLAWLILRSEDIRLFQPKGKRIAAVFESIAGLDDKSAVRVAGVRVGRVDGIGLVDGKAVVGLLLEEPIGLTEGTVAQISNLGLLGDKYVELLPGPPGAPPLPEGAAIPGRSPASMDAVIASLADLGQSLRKVTGQLTGEVEVEGPLGRLVVNLEATSGELRSLLGSNRARLDASVENFYTVSATLATELPRISEQLAGLLAEVRSVVAENRGALQGSLANVEEATASVQDGIRNLNVVAERLARGEGTLGKLLASDEAHDELLATLDSLQGGVGALSDTLGRAQRLRLDLALQSYYLEGIEGSRGALALNLATASGNDYRIEVVDDPRGKETVESTTITVIDADGSSSTRTVESVTAEDEITFTALYGLPLTLDDEERFRLWAGIIESAGGLQLEYRPAGRWWLSMEAFDFNRSRDLEAHLRLTAGWRLNDHFFVLGGYDDFLTDDYRSLFLGGGVRWQDDDLKYLLGSVASF